MEKFAERYVKCNPEAFRSADVAYVLAYSELPQQHGLTQACLAAGSLLLAAVQVILVRADCCQAWFSHSVCAGVIMLNTDAHNPQVSSQAASLTVGLYGSPAGPLL